MRQATPSTHLGQPGAPQAKVFWYKLLGQWFLSELVSSPGDQQGPGRIQISPHTTRPVGLRFSHLGLRTTTQVNGTNVDDRRQQDPRPPSTLPHRGSYGGIRPRGYGGQVAVYYYLNILLPPQSPRTWGTVVTRESHAH